MYSVLIIFSRPEYEAYNSSLSLSISDITFSVVLMFFSLHVIRRRNFVMFRYPYSVTASFTSKSFILDGPPTWSGFPLTILSSSFFGAHEKLELY